MRETLRTAQQVASLSKAARRPIPHGVVLTRWKAKGLSERATLDSLAEAGLPIMAQALSDLTDYSKLSFSGAVPLSGKVGIQADRPIVYRAEQRIRRAIGAPGSPQQGATMGESSGR